MTARFFFRRSIAILLAVAATGVVSVAMSRTASAQHDPAVESFLTSIYSTYKGSSDSGKGIRLDSEAAIRRYFAPSIADAMIKDMADAKKRGDVPKLDGDPFIDGQDWDIAKFGIAVKEAASDKVVGTVTINNFGKDIPLILDLTKGKDGWRIADIMWERGDTLRGLYFKGEAPPPVTKKPEAKSKTPPPKAAKKQPQREQKS